MTRDAATDVAVVEHSVDLPAELTAPSYGRQVVADVLGKVGAGVDLADTAVLLTSELVTNAHCHVPESARPEASPRLGPTLTIRVGAGVVRVNVRDSSTTLPKVRDQAEDAETGRGLWLVEQLATRWGADALPHGAGKQVWFELTL